MKACMVIPFSGDEVRIPVFKKVLEFYKKTLPGIKIIVANSGHIPFNLSASKNSGIKEATMIGAKTVILNDADGFNSPKSIINAIRISRNFNEIVAPYNNFITHSNYDETKEFLKSFDFNLKVGSEHAMPSISNETGLPLKLVPCSGTLVMPSNIFEEIGYFNEAIVGWGPEDRVFHRAYYNRFDKIFTYIDGIHHSAYVGPVKRGLTKENEEFYNLSDSWT